MPGSRFTKMNRNKPIKPSSSTSNQQRTLFQAWGSRMSTGPSVTSETTSKTDIHLKQFQPNSVCSNDAMDVEDEDELLMQALEQSTNLSREIGTTSFEFPNAAAEIDLSSIPDLPDFDKYAGHKWIYPTNYPVRAYQFDIVESALFQNTLVALPTGLGKTFIAAVVMFNFYRWYPLSKIVFMAPTKPLVAQQIEACYNVMGIPQSDIAEMTGKMSPVARQKAWKEKRVIFLTPQVLSNDLTRGTCEAAKIKCLVVDEAHRSLGNYAYCLVVKELAKITRNFRILALSATPGSNLTMVQDVISNLLISNIELRTDDSPEIKMYSFERKVEKIVVAMGEELRDVEKQYIMLLESIVNRLVKEKVLYRRNAQSLSKFLILKCRDEFRQNPPQHIQPAQMGVIEGDFALAMSMYHGYELLQLHGLRSFYQYLQSLVNGDKGYGRTRSELMKNQNFMHLFDALINKFGERPSIPFTQQTSQEKSEQYVIGHPKLEKLQEIVLEHLRKFQKDDGSTETRVIIFSQYRNSVSDITEMLKRHQPLVKVISFMGQAMKKETKGFTQKEQLRVMKAFRDGLYNTLVSTCVGEEGLDIGDVDLIICFDASKSPIRLVQRMGRTGRKRDGRIVMLVTEGKEDQIYKQSQYSKNSINKALQNGTKSLHYYQESPRMLPDCLVPQCHKMYITIKNNFENLETEKARKKQEKKKVVKGKMKTILPEERSLDGRLTPVSNSNSSIQSTERRTVVENSDAEDNLRVSSPPDCILLSNDELPNLSPQKNIWQPPKVVPGTKNTGKKKSCAKTNKKKTSVQKENTKIKEVRKKKEESRTEQILIVDDDDNASDFIEEPEPAHNLPIFDDNGTPEFIFKSQLNRSKQEPPKSSLSKNNPAENCFVPVAPSLENISEMLNILEAQGQQRIPPDLSSLVDVWVKEFNAKVKSAGILSSPSREREMSTHTHIQATSPAAALSSDCVAGNDGEGKFSILSPDILDVEANNKYGAGSPDLSVLTAIMSPSRNCHMKDGSLPILNYRKRKHSFANSEESKKHRSLKSPEREMDKKGQSAPSNLPLITILSQQNCSLSKSSSLDLDHHKQKLLIEEVDSLESKQQSLKSHEGGKNTGKQSVTLNVLSVTTSPRENCLLSDPSSPHLSHHEQRLPFKDIGPSESRICQSLERSSETVQPISFGKEYPDRKETRKNKSSMESVRENSKLVDSYGDLFTDFSSSFNDAVNKSASLPERSKERLPEAEKQTRELPVIRDSRNSDKDINEEAVSSEDDHLIFDLTTDMFSEDEFDHVGTKSDRVEAHADDPSSSVPKVLSEIDAHKTTDPVISDKSCDTSYKLSSRIVSFVNTKISTDSSKGDGNKYDADDEEEELPLFDLGFEFDAIPPTPDLKNTQPLSSITSQSNVGSSTPISVQNNKDSHPRTENGSSAVQEVNLISSSEEEEELGGFRCVLPAMNISGHLQYHSTPVPVKRHTSEELFTPCLKGKERTSPSPLRKDEESNISQSSLVSQGFDLIFDDLLDDDHLAESELAVKTNRKETAQMSSQNEHDSKYESSDDCLFVRKIRKKCVMLSSPSPLHQRTSTSFTDANETMEDEDSFCIRKKKKKSAVLTSPLTSNQSDNEPSFEKKVENVDTPKTFLSKKKENCSQGKRFVDEIQSQDDFVTDENVQKRKTGDTNRKLCQKSHRPARQAEQFKGRQFLDEEAVLSGSEDDGLSDDELEEGDNYDQSFINDFSQVDHTQNMVDMRAVYLQSVVSPVARHCGYTMRYDRPNVRDVYSCPPETDEDYEHDSFCVESAESSLNETAIIDERPKKDVGKKSKKKCVIRPESSSEESGKILKNLSHTHTTNNKSENKDPSKEVVSNDQRNEPIQILDSQSENEECENLDRLVIFADSREISGAQAIISDLRLKHQLNVVVTKLESCDYMVSLRTAVERKAMSDFVNGANNKKLVKRLEDMCEYYERPCLIVEKNAQKGPEGKNVPRVMPQTKYLETLLSQLSLSRIRLLFSENKNETCNLLASLCCQENVKGQAICKDQVVSDYQQQKLKFFMALPKVNCALALNLCRNFKTIKEFLESSASLIATRSKMSSERACYLHKLIRQKFR